MILQLPENEFSLLSEHKEFLSSLFIVSSAEIKPSSGKIEGAYESGEIEGMSVVIERAEGKKCERCWNWSAAVGTFGDEPELCDRCYNVIK